MVNKTDTQIPQLIINKLTKEQYEEALAQGLISETELYAVTDEDDYVTVNAFNNIIANYTTTENLANVALSGEYSDLLNVPTVDQTYNGSSANAQSGVAISGLIANYSTTDSFSNVAFSGDFADLTNVPAAATVDQVYNGSSTNAQSGTAVAGLIANYMTSTEVSDAISNAISTVYKYKGSVATYADLPSSGQEVGDVYNVEEDGHNYAWTGTDWDRLAGTVDLSNYVTLNTVQTITNKTINLGDNTIIGLSTVATSGEYSDLLNKPTIDQIYNGSSANAQSGVAISGLIANYSTTDSFSNVAFSGEYNDILNTPDLANVALSGEYSDLLNTPTIDQTYNGSSANAQSGTAVAGLIANYMTSTEVASAISNAIASVYRYKGSVATYADLPSSDLTVGDVYNVEEDGANYAWTGTSWDKLSENLSNYVTINGAATLTNKTIDLADNTIIGLSTVATSGEYSDLLNKPTIDQTYNGSSVNAQSGVAVASAISDMQVVSNMVDTISNTSTNTTYPTTSAVYNSIANLSGVVFREWE